MIVRERDKKNLKKQLEENRERVEQLRSDLADLESEIYSLESDIAVAEKKLAEMEGEEEEYVLARNKPRPKNEIKLVDFEG
jgi:septal ring factor EnvC (AmiA/AmiB activator)